MRTMTLASILAVMLAISCRNTGSELSDGGLDDDDGATPTYRVGVELKQDGLQLDDVKALYAKAGKPKPTTSLFITAIEDFDGFPRTSSTIDKMQENDKRIADLLKEVEAQYKISVPKEDATLNTWTASDELSETYRLGQLEQNSAKIKRRIAALRAKQSK